MQLKSRFMRRLLALGMAGALAGCAGGTGSLPYLPAPESNTYLLDAGDQLRINIHGLEPFDDTTFVVADDGTLSLPLIADLPVTGKTITQVEAEIKQVLIDRDILTDPFVNVQAAELRPFYIMGEVNQPGEYAYRPGLSAMAAVSIAGGFTYRANEDSLVVSRMIDGRRVEGRVAPTDPIRPGDQITVAERWF